jgi:hypothetical protein
MTSRILTLILLLAPFASAQQLAVGLASPNTRDSLTYADAKASLISFEEQNFVAVADRIVCSLAKTGTVQKVIGEVHEKNQMGVEGAENSIVVKAMVSFEEMRYTMALLGRYAHQKFVVAFLPNQETGSNSATLVVLHIPPATTHATLEHVLDDTGVPYRTLAGEDVIIFLPEGSPDAPVKSAARRLKARMEIQHGRGEIVGNDDRTQAAATYDKIIADYEAAHSDHAQSAKLWSRDWRDAESRTCTLED